MKRILIVDDEEAIIDILRIMMVKEGYEVKVANNGIEAMNVMKKYNAFNSEEQVFDIIITDIVMPEMNGFDLAIAINNKLPEQSILFISAFNNSVELFNFVDQRKNVEYLAKPFGFEELKNKLRLLNSSLKSKDSENGNNNKSRFQLSDHQNSERANL